MGCRDWHGFFPESKPPALPSSSSSSSSSSFPFPFPFPVPSPCPFPSPKNPRRHPDRQRRGRSHGVRLRDRCRFRLRVRCPITEPECPSREPVRPDDMIFCAICAICVICVPVLHRDRRRSPHSRRRFRPRRPRLLQCCRWDAGRDDHGSGGHGRAEDGSRECGARRDGVLRRGAADARGPERDRDDAGSRQHRRRAVRGGDGGAGQSRYRQSGAVEHGEGRRCSRGRRTGQVRAAEHRLRDAGAGDRHGCHGRIEKAAGRGWRWSPGEVGRRMYRAPSRPRRDAMFDALETGPRGQSPRPAALHVSERCATASDHGREQRHDHHRGRGGRVDAGVVHTKRVNSGRERASEGVFEEFDSTSGRPARNPVARSKMGGNGSGRALGSFGFESPFPSRGCPT